MSLIEGLQETKENREHGMGTIVHLSVPDSVPDKDYEIGDPKHCITIEIELQSGKTFSENISPPRTWDAGEPFVSLLQHYGIEPENYDDLVGKKVNVEHTRRAHHSKFEWHIDEAYFNDADNPDEGHLFTDNA